MTGRSGAWRPATTGSLAGDLRGLGLRAGQVVLAHASMRRIGRVAGGAAAVAAALREALGVEGTLVVPAFTADNSDSSHDHLARVRGLSAAEIARFRAGMPAFDAAATPSTGMGAVAEQVRTAAGALRSAHPQTSFAALGPMAEKVVSGHRPDCHLGEDSPLARLYSLDAQILLLGVGYDVCTAFHLAEYRRRPPPPLRRYRCVVAGPDGRPQWWEYRDAVLDDSDFAALGGDWERTGPVRRGLVGSAASRLMPLAAAVDFAADWLARRRPGRPGPR